MVAPRADIDATGSQTETGVRVAGAWLVVGSVIWVPALALHPPLPPDMGDFMERVADTGTRWVVAHWLAAIALSIFALASLIVLAATSRLTRGGLGITAWALLPVAALWVSTTAVAEATVISSSAVSGDVVTFAAWDAFAEGRAMGFLGIALAVTLIALSEARAAQAAVPDSVAWIGVAVGVVAFVSWLLGRPVLGLGIGGPLFVVSAVVMGLWIFWFGVGLVRASSRAR